MFNYVSFEKPLTVTKADSGETNHYWRKQDALCLTHLQFTTLPPVTPPDGSSLHPTQQGTIPITSILSPGARRATVHRSFLSDNYATMIANSYKTKENCMWSKPRI